MTEFMQNKVTLLAKAGIATDLVAHKHFYILMDEQVTQHGAACRENLGAARERTDHFRFGHACSGPCGETSQARPVRDSLAIVPRLVASRDPVERPTSGETGSTPPRS